ncbi:MAG: hypothetical protein PHR23_03025 [bacterium]|nr:hypothetical protein [bacterium]
MNSVMTYVFRELIIILSELVDFSQSTLADNEGIFWLLDAEHV